MNFIVSLAHFVGWVVVISAFVYFVVFVSVSLFALIFLYEKEKQRCSRIFYFFQVGIKFWIWIIVSLSNVFAVAWLRFLIKKGYSFEQLADHFIFDNLTVHELKRWSKKSFSQCGYFPLSHIF
ncbi:MAG: hypothetical protein WCT49_02920 [Candidatus Paceibacterota bacterium]|jgi:hypothetical protein|nr:hypothetical protein [Candidatus Paceibacterota bacterium]